MFCKLILQSMKYFIFSWVYCHCFPGCSRVFKWGKISVPATVQVSTSSLRVLSCCPSVKFCPEWKSKWTWILRIRKSKFTCWHNSLWAIQQGSQHFRGRNAACYRNLFPWRKWQLYKVAYMASYAYKSHPPTSNLSDLSISKKSPKAWIYVFFSPLHIPHSQPCLNSGTPWLTLT